MQRVGEVSVWTVPRLGKGSGVTPGGKGINRFYRAKELEGGAKGEWTLWGGSGPDQTPS